MMLQLKDRRARLFRQRIPFAAVVTLPLPTVRF